MVPGQHHGDLADRPLAFAIPSTSALPALASFCAYTSINIFFLWVLVATFFVTMVVLDDQRHRSNRRT